MKRIERAIGALIGAAGVVLCGMGIWLLVNLALEAAAAGNLLMTLVGIAMLLIFGGLLIAGAFWCVILAAAALALAG